ncbi:hypothetical protein ACOME3_002345 [Neoechinorhynchus agilis]
MLLLFLTPIIFPIKRTSSNILSAVHFKEDSPPGTFLTCIKDQVDMPLGELESNTFDNKASELFRYDNSTLSVYSRKWVDREDLERNNHCTMIDNNCYLYLQIYLMTNVDSQFYSLPIAILDMDDNAPTFRMQHFKLKVNENENRIQAIPLPFADDDDYLDKNNLNYRLTYSNLLDAAIFELENGTNLLIKKPLDREKNPYHNLGLVARSRQLETVLPISISNSCSVPTSLPVKLRINALNDLNDNAPECGRNRFVVGDTYVGRIGRLIATDSDSGVNRELRMGFPSSAKPDYLDINGSDNSLYVTKSIRASGIHHDQLMFKFQVSDKGYPPLSTYCHVALTVKKAPEYLLTTKNTVNLQNRVIYIPDNMKKADTLIELTFKENDVHDDPFSIECRSKLLHCEKHSSRINAIVLSKNLLDVQDNNEYDIVIIVVRDKYPLVRTENLYFVRLIAVDAITIREPQNQTTLTLSVDIEQPLIQLKVQSISRTIDSARFDEKMEWKVECKNLNLHIKENGSVYLKRVYRPGLARVMASLVGAVSGYEYQSIGFNVLVKPEIIGELRRKLKKRNWMVDEQSERDANVHWYRSIALIFSIMFVIFFGIGGAVVLPALRKKPKLILCWRGNRRNRRKRGTGLISPEVAVSRLCQRTLSLGDDYLDVKTIASDKTNPSSSMRQYCNGYLFKSVDRIQIPNGHCEEDYVGIIWEHLDNRHSNPDKKNIVYGKTADIQSHKSSFV